MLLQIKKKIELGGTSLHVHLYILSDTHSVKFCAISHENSQPVARNYSSSVTSK